MANKNAQKQVNSRCCSFKSLPELDDEVVSGMSEYMGSKLKVKENKEDFHAVLALCGSYVLIIFPRAAFAAIQSNMKDELGFTNNDISTLLVASASSYVLGKAFNGMIVDCLDARYVLFFFMTMSTLASFGWSFMDTKESMYPWIFVNMYCQAGTWPCMAKLIYNWFDANAYNQIFSYLSISSKLGSFFTLLVLGAVVSASDWRWTLRVASFVLALGIVYAVIMMSKRSAPPEREDHRPMTGKDEGRGCGALCKVISKSARFWFSLVAISMMTVLAGMENYMALWLTDVFRPCTDTEGDMCESLFDSGHAAIISSLLPLGLILSLIYGQMFLVDVDPKKEAKVNLQFLIMATIIAVIFSVWSTMVESGARPKETPWDWIGVLSIFILLFGFFIGYPYYIPIAVYSVKVGGMNSATLSAILDLGGFVVLTLFAYFGTALSESEGVSETAQSTWKYNLYCVVIVAILAVTSMFGFQYYNLKSYKSPALRQSVLSFRRASSFIKLELGKSTKLGGDPALEVTEQGHKIVS